MPLYEYICRSCKKEFEATQPLAEHGKVTPACPRCGSKRAVEAELSRVFARTSRKS
jgi:putative FmdB family regulatory protein